MNRRKEYEIRSPAFICDGQKQFMTVEFDRLNLIERLSHLAAGVGADEWRPWQLVRRRSLDSHAIVDETVCMTPSLSTGCRIMRVATSASGRWLVSERCSGQGEWGYDVLRTSPLQREAGLDEEYGYMLDLPQFSADESRLVGGYGDNWQGGWWAHEDDDPEEAARGGPVSFGFLFVHLLPSHRVTRHELMMDLPPGWLPEDVEAETWYGAWDIRPEKDGVRLVLPGGAPIEIEGPLPQVIKLPTPHPAGRRLI